MALNVQVIVSAIDRMTGPLGTMSGGAKGFESSMKSLGRSAQWAGAAVTGALTAMVYATVNAGDQMDEMSIRTGIGTRTLSSLGFVAQRSSVSMDSLERSLRFAQKSAVTSSAAWAKYGINVKATDGHFKNADVLLGEAADKFLKINDSTRKAAAAQELFGKSGSELLPMMTEGGKGLNALRARARELGLEWDPKAAKAAGIFDDSLGDLKGSVQGLSYTIGGQLMPQLQPMIEMLTTGIVKLREFAEAHPMAGAGLGAAAGGVQAAGGAAGATADVLGALWYGKELTGGKGGWAVRGARGVGRGVSGFFRGAGAEAIGGMGTSRAATSAAAFAKAGRFGTGARLGAEMIGGAGLGTMGAGSLALSATGIGAVVAGSVAVERASASYARDVRNAARNADVSNSLLERSGFAVAGYDASGRAKLVPTGRRRAGAAPTAGMGYPNLSNQQRAAYGQWSAYYGTQAAEASSGLQSRLGTYGMDPEARNLQQKMLQANRQYVQVQLVLKGDELRRIIDARVKQTLNAAAM